MKWLPTWEIQPGIYAMCGAAAMLGGVFRASISLVVIFVEGSQVSCNPALMMMFTAPTVLRTTIEKIIDLADGSAYLSGTITHPSMPI